MRSFRTRALLVLALTLTMIMTVLPAGASTDEPSPEAPPANRVSIDESGLFTSPAVAASVGEPWAYVGGGANPQTLNTAPIGAQYHSAIAYIPASQFVPEGGQTGQWEVGGCIFPVGDNWEAHAALDLPNGAEITGVWFTVYDKSDTDAVTVWLRRIDVTTGDPGGWTDTTVESGTSTGTAGSGGWTTEAITVDPVEVVGVQGEGLLLGGTRWHYLEVNVDSATTFCGAHVYYRVPASGADLVFSPVTPCTIFDSRISKGGTGPFANGEQRNINVVGALNLSAQGGNAAGCGLPDWSSVLFGQANQTKAIAVQIVVINPNGSGSTKLWAGQAAEPGEGGVIAWASGEVIESSSAIVPLRTACSTFITNTCTARRDLSIKFPTGGGDLKLVVTGYFADMPNLSR